MVTRKPDDNGPAGFLSRWSQRKRATRDPRDDMPHDPRDDMPRDPRSETSRDPRNETSRDPRGMTTHDPAEAKARRRKEEPDAESAQAAPGVEADVPAIKPEDLPDIDSLTETSDFSPFMQDGVPPALKQRALRRMWQLDPAFRDICMLDDYNLDYTDAATVVPNLKTLFQVGRGMVLPEEEEAAEQTAEAAEPDSEAGVAAEEPAEALPPQDAAPAPAAETASAPEARRRKPGTPLVAPAAGSTRQTSQQEARPAGKSARQRRWGDPGA